MSAMTAIRAKLDAVQIARGLQGFSARRREDVEVQPCGVAELDALLGGGFPRGSVVEVCGAGSSGRTSLSFALLAQATRRQEACAFVDVSDALDPMSVAAAGVDSKWLLWIRCGGAEGSEIAGKAPGSLASDKKSGSREDDSGGMEALPNAAKRSSKQFREKQPSFAWTHPRDTLRGVETSFPMLMRRPLKAPSYEEMNFAVRCAGEQVEPDRQEPRRGENLRPRWLPRTAPEVEKEKPAFPSRGQRTRIRELTTDCLGWIRTNTKPWKRLEQALKTTDLLLHSGGWGVVVVDLAGISWVEARRIPIHTWFRFRRVVENSPTILLLLGEESCAKSCASLVLQCKRVGERWSSTIASAQSAAECEASFARLGKATLQGFEVQGEVACSRMQRLEVEAVRWQTRMI